MDLSTLEEMTSRTPSKNTRAQTKGRSELPPSVAGACGQLGLQISGAAAAMGSTVGNLVKSSRINTSGKINFTAAPTTAQSPSVANVSAPSTANVIDAAPNTRAGPTSISSSQLALALGRHTVSSDRTIGEASTVSAAAAPASLLQVPRVGQWNEDIANELADDDAIGAPEIEQRNNSFSTEASDEVPAAAPMPADMNAVRAELALVRAQEELLNARLRVQQLQTAMNAVPSANHNASVVTKRRIKAVDVEYLVPFFTGDDEYGVRKWISDFEDIMTTLDADNDDRYKMARHLVRDTARIFLRTISVRSYDELRQALVQRYDRQVSYYEVYDRLRSRHRRREESLLQYITSMQEISHRVNMDESELVSLIIAGLRDSSSYISILAGAADVNSLIRLIPAYERTVSLSRHHQNTSASTSASTSGGGQRRPPQPNRAGGNHQAPLPRLPSGAIDMANVRCNNCSEMGHMARNCPRPSRAPGSCFICGGTDHVRTNCPKRKKTVAVVQTFEDHGDDQQQHQHDDEDELALALSNMPSVSISFAISHNQCTHAKHVRSLLDTGSPASFVSRSQLPSNYALQRICASDYSGVGGKTIHTYGKVNCYVKLYHRLKYVPVFIVPDDTFPVDVLIGRDVLDIFEIGLYFRDTKLQLQQNIFNIHFNKIPVIVDQPAASLPIKETNALNKVDFENVNMCTSDYQPLSFSVDNSPEPQPVEPLATSVMASYETPSDIPYDLASALHSENSNFVSDFSIEHDCELSSLETVSDLAYDIEPTLDIALRDCVEECILHNYVNIDQSLVKPPSYEMTIQLDHHTPFFSHARRLSYTERAAVRKIIQGLLDEGKIKPSDSPYACPITTPRKKNGDIRLCVDYRALNQYTPRDNYPLPLIDDCLDYLNNKTIFSLLDLKSGFHQVKIAASSTKYTSFVTPDGQYEYLSMPFGLKNGPSIFQRFINRILKPFMESNQIVVYMDDILVASKTMDEHLTLLSDVLHCIAVNGLELQLAKCKFAYRSLEYLGFSVSSEGIKPGTAKSLAVQQFPRPMSAKNVHSFLGLCSFFRRFIPGFAQKASPLYKLLHKDATFDFNANCVHAFESLQKLLTSAPVLSIYDPTRETELHTDASKLGYGAVLLQRQEDNKFHPVAYFSKSIGKHEINYHSYELETLAVVYALARFRVYLAGIKFTIVTDCNSLALTFNKKDVNSRIARWVWEFQRFDCVAKYRKGTAMGHADALSRNPVVAMISTSDINFQLQATQNRDPKITKLKDTLVTSESPPYEMHDGIVYKRNSADKLLFYVPSEMEQQLIHHMHEKIGHFGSSKCYDQMRSNYWMPHMQEKIETFTRNCVKCLIYSAPTKTSERSLYSIPKKPIPFDTIHIDHFGPLPSVTSKQKHLLVIVDSFTKFVKVYPATSTSTKEVCRALEKYFEFYSRPARVISDRGTCFTSLEFSEFMEKHNIQHIKNAVASPQANGQVERVNRILKNMLGKLTEPLQHSDWTKQIKHVEYAINNTLQKSVGMSPSQLLFGTNQKGPNVDYLTEYLDDLDINSPVRNLKSMREIASANIRKSQSYSQNWTEEHCTPAKIYSVGDFVVIRNVDTSVGNKKLIPKFRGPYIVHKTLVNDRYVIRDIENCPITQLPYDSIVEARHLRLWKSSQH